MILTVTIGGTKPEPGMRWADLGSDAYRIWVLDVIEEAVGVPLSDADRESIQTVGDLAALVARRVHA